MPAGFLDLSAELRNQVYHDALVHDREEGKIATVALLRANRQIHNEAHGVLHAQSTFLISVSPIKSRHRINKMVGAASSLKFGGDCLALPYYRTTTSERVLRALPQAMLKVSKIKVRIQVPELSRRGSIEVLNQPIDRFTAALWRHLNSDQQKRQLEVTLVNEGCYAGSRSQIADDFIGLAFLGSHVDLKLQLFDEEAVEHVQSLRKAILDTSKETITEMY
ncbi:hypothetical protein PRZ48_010992 [Zasmidium cellare]|uniref:Uncharacterized protein n=1 Tax=Zasmidium cellare TaxID=395010 RepID=A0ABR0EA72_ZASCE|nr:hypothetical protein PRZ48_010992 [Zasmidium cellare]